jgi:hypothetical protein
LPLKIIGDGRRKRLQNRLRQTLNSWVTNLKLRLNLTSRAYFVCAAEEDFDRHRQAHRLDVLSSPIAAVR